MGVLAGAIGRKKTIMALCFPLLIGWAIVGLSKVQAPKYIEDIDRELIAHFNFWVDMSTFFVIFGPIVVKFW